MYMKHMRSIKRRNNRHTRRRGGAIVIPSMPITKSITEEPVLIADKIGKNVTDSIKKAQVSILQSQYAAKEQTRKVTDAIKGFGQSITQKLSSLFGGSRRSKRGGKTKTAKRRYSKH